MRRWMAVCIAVLIAFFVSPTVFGAETEQELFVNDVRVTEANAKDVLGDGTVRCSRRAFCRRLETFRQASYL